MSRITDEVLGHAQDNDGIEEYDNPLPTWWLGLFAVTIVWGVAYGVNYHFVAGDSQLSRYRAEMAAAAERWPVSEPGGLVYDDETLAEGEKIFETTCVSCHMAKGRGGPIGPSLVDAIWIHGAEPEQIRTTITEGVPEKGMPTWGNILGPAKVAQVAAYVVKLHEASGAGVDGASVDGASVDGASVDGAAPDGAAPDGAAGVDGADAAVDGGGEPLEPLAAGQQVFEQYCVPCHLADLTGATGPNLVDDEWLHGGELEQIVKTVTNGVPGKAMIAWGPILGDEKIKLVSEYVHHKANP